MWFGGFLFIWGCVVSKGFNVGIGFRHRCVEFVVVIMSFVIRVGRRQMGLVLIKVDVAAVSFGSSSSQSWVFSHLRESDFRVGHAGSVNVALSGLSVIWSNRLRCPAVSVVFGDSLGGVRNSCFG